ncbi:MAG: Na+/H+ antiporter subunit E [Mariniphaga sp.]|nr:Na+/H+ antiporter subunit E [Mariniphaga sp.]MDD4227184.1 Na+/H+ antiporter subunit E [Mariniphaga sp.]
MMKRAYYLVTFIVFYLYKLIEANFYIAWDILTPKMNSHPVFMEIPLTLTTNLGLLLYSNLLSMTPGSLSMDISPDRKKLKVHVLYFTTEEEMMREFMNIQQKIKRITG